MAKNYQGTTRETEAGALLTAKDVMSQAVISVSPHDSLGEAMEIIVENSISGLPVIDSNGRLAGIISEMDRIKISAAADVEDARVADYMTQGVITVDENATLNQIAALLVRAGIRRLPVMSNGRVIGIVSRRDLVRVLETNKNTR